MDAYEKRLARNYCARAMSALVAADDAIANAESEVDSNSEGCYLHEREQLGELIEKFADEVKRWTAAELADDEGEPDDGKEAAHA